MARDRFNTDPLVQIPAGALAALVQMAEIFVDGSGPTASEITFDAIHEARKCALAQGVTMRVPQDFFADDPEAESHLILESSTIVELGQATFYGHTFDVEAEFWEGDHTRGDLHLHYPAGNLDSDTVERFWTDVEAWLRERLKNPKFTITPRESGAQDHDFISYSFDQEENA